ncbi:MAG: diguanylate cyclase [Anaerovoracaceae bacterium]
MKQEEATINDKSTHQKNTKELETKERLLQLMKSTDLSIREFVDRALELAICLTGSKIGYIFLYYEEEEVLNLFSYSDVAMKECQIKDQPRLYHLSKTGLWGEVIRQRKAIILNNYQQPHELKKGYPEGHVTLSNFLSVPVFSNGKIVAVVGVANKDSDYNNADGLELSLLMNTIWPMVELRQQQENLRQSEKRYKLLYEANLKEKELLSTIVSSAAEGILVLDSEAKIVLMNPAAEQSTGYSLEEAAGRKFDGLFTVLNNKTNRRITGLPERVMASGRRMEKKQPLKMIVKDGGHILVTGTMAPIRCEKNKASGVVITFEDISKEMLLEREIQGYLNINMDIFSVADRDGKFIRANRKFEEVLGYTTDEIRGKNCLTFIHPDDRRPTVEMIRQLRNGGKEGRLINRVRCKDGSYKYLEWRLETGLEDYYFSVARDVTERVKYEEMLKNLAMRDELTQLYNRNYLTTVITDIMRYADRYQESLSLLILDLDDFKNINDAFGHLVGDKILRKFAAVVNQNLRKSDLLFRFGGEEFIVVMPKTDLEGATAVAEKLRSAVEKIRVSVVRRLTVSIGVSERIGDEPFTLWFGRADEALYRAKNNGKNKVVPAIASHQTER